LIIFIVRFKRNKIIGEKEPKNSMECQIQEIDPDQHNRHPDYLIEYLPVHSCLVLDLFADIAKYLFSRQFPFTPYFLKPPSEKTSLIFAFRWPFRGPDGIKYVAKTASILGPLVANRRGAFLPYFGKHSEK